LNKLKYLVKYSFYFKNKLFRYNFYKKGKESLLRKILFNKFRMETNLQYFNFKIIFVKETANGIQRLLKEEKCNTLKIDQ
jgi:hypothetical protein